MVNFTVFHCPLGERFHCLTDLECRGPLCSRVPGISYETPEIEELVKSMLCFIVLVKAIAVIRKSSTYHRILCRRRVL